MADYISAARRQPLPGRVVDKTVQHLIDTVAAMVSGSELASGRRGRDFAEAQGGPEEATLLATGRKLGTIWAAFGNAMAAHADETDDSHHGGRFHPGCATVPVALAAAEAEGASGTELLRAVALGYDVGARAVRALNLDPNRKPRHSTHSIGSLFGATAAAAALMRLDPRQCRWALSYAAQQASGVPAWKRDLHHVEKAFDFAAMPARNALHGVALVAAGWTGVDDALTGEDGYLEAFSDDPRPDELTGGLGERFEIEDATIKKWCVGSPIQAALDSLEVLMAGGGVRPDSVSHIVVTMPDDRLHLVDNRTMPDICLQHLLSVMLVDGGLTFETSHDAKRMNDPAVRAVRKRIELVPSRELTVARPARQAIVEVHLTDGRHLRRHTRAVAGTPDAPMSEEEVSAKARDLMGPTLGEAATETVLQALRGADEAGCVTDLIPRRVARR